MGNSKNLLWRHSRRSVAPSFSFLGPSTGVKSKFFSTQQLEYDNFKCEVMCGLLHSRPCALLLQHVPVSTYSQRSASSNPSTGRKYEKHSKRNYSSQHSAGFQFLPFIRSVNCGWGGKKNFKRFNEQSERDDTVKAHYPKLAATHWEQFASYVLRCGAVNSS